MAADWLKMTSAAKKTYFSSNLIGCHGYWAILQGKSKNDVAGARDVCTDQTNHSKAFL